jgi:hypothetical protein
MLTHSRKINSSIGVFAALLISASRILAQDNSSAVSPSSVPSPSSAAPSVPAPASPISPNGQGVAQSAAQVVPQGSSNGDSSTTSALDYLYNHKAQQGTVAKEGMDANQQAKTDAIAQDALGNDQIADPDIRAQSVEILRR